MISRWLEFHAARRGLSFVLLLILLAVLWVAGGSARADVAGQAIVRGVAATLLVIAILFASRGGDGSRSGWPRAVAWLVLGTVLIPVLQLVPLPPDWWEALPHRAPFAQAVDGVQPWRPLAIVPDATGNALGSLLVPLAVLVLSAGLREGERGRLVAVMLVLVAASMLVGLAQLSGIRFDNPFINYEPGRVSGTFANRNHFALYLAMGCVIAPAWALQSRDLQGGARQRDSLQGGQGAARWRLPTAFGLVMLFLLLILATGSRAGMLAGAAGLAAGVLLVRQHGAAALPRAPAWVPPAVGLSAACMVSLMVAFSVAADRAPSVDRAMGLDAVEDLRVRAFPTVIAMIGTYFPAGTGFGAFDPMFRLHEPLALLKGTYFNHAHDDFLEIMLEGGLPALLLAGTALAWWARGSIRVWLCGAGSAKFRGAIPGQAGSAVILLVMIASIFDYPARTPMIMATVVMAAALLDWSGGRSGSRGRIAPSTRRRGHGPSEYI